jgi:N-acetylmuramoyl-L-alanine amidase
MNFGKVGFDPGHYAGVNAGPGTYREGDVMLKLGLMLQQKGFFITRTDGKDLSFPVRTAKADTAGCNTLISLHTNAPKEAGGILIFYSMHRPGDKVMAEYIGQELSKATGIPFRAAKTRPSTTYPTQDYYGMIRNPVNAGIEHVFIIEHGSHWEMAVDTEKKLQAIADCYASILSPKATETLQNVQILFDNKILTDRDKWLKKASSDSDVYWLIKKMADKLKKG